MIPILMVLVGIIYFAIGTTYALNGNYGMFFAFLCYALANVGIYLGAK